MRQARTPGFEGLEGRLLLSRSRGHHPMVHVAAAAPLSLDGTLTADNAAQAATMNADGSTTTITPVSGTLGALGAVRGTWSVTDDSAGNYVGPDTLRVRNASGTVLLAFDQSSPGPVHRVKHGPSSSEVAQQALGGTGAYAHTAERGTVTLTTNAARTQVVSLTFATRGG